MLDPAGQISCSGLVSLKQHKQFVYFITQNGEIQKEVIQEIRGTGFKLEPPWRLPVEDSVRIKCMVGTKHMVYLKGGQLVKFNVKTFEIESVIVFEEYLTVLDIQYNRNNLYILFDYQNFIVVYFDLFKIIQKIKFDYKHQNTQMSFNRSGDCCYITTEVKGFFTILNLKSYYYRTFKEAEVKIISWKYDNEDAIVCLNHLIRVNRTEGSIEILVFTLRNQIISSSLF